MNRRSMDREYRAQRRSDRRRRRTERRYHGECTEELSVIADYRRSEAMALLDGPTR